MQVETRLSAGMDGLRAGYGRHGSWSLFAANVSMVIEEDRKERLGTDTPPPCWGASTIFTSPIGYQIGTYLEPLAKVPECAGTCGGARRSRLFFSNSRKFCGLIMRIPANVTADSG